MQYMIRAGVVLALLSALAVPSYAATSTTLQNAVAADGNGTAASVYDTGLVGLQVTITGKARVDFEGSSDGGTTYAGIICLRSGSTGGYVSNTSASGMYHCNVPGLSNIRTPVVGWQTGTVTVVSNALTAPHNVLLAGEDQPNNALMTEGAAVRSTTMASAVTTNTTSTAVALPTGSKSIYGSVTGTGAITQTQAIYGGITSGVTSTTGILLCTLTLSGTTAVYDACPVMTANFLFYIVVTTATTGTGAAGTVTAMY